MKHFLLLLLTIVIASSTLTGCTRHSYAIYTTDGRTIISDGKPSESRAGLLKYTDANGFKQQINKSLVKEVTEIPD